MRLMPDSNFSWVWPVEDLIKTVKPVTWAVVGGDRKSVIIRFRFVASLAGTAAGSTAVTFPEVAPESCTKAHELAACAAPPDISKLQVGEVAEI